MTKRIYWGFVLALLAVLLGGLLFIRGCQDIYWANPAVFILLTVIGVVSALCGGFLIGRNLTVGTEGRMGLLRRFSIGLGALIALLGGFLGVSAIGLALGVSSTGYWGHAPYDDYNGDYMIMGLQIMAFQVCIMPEIFGGFLLGFGQRMKA